MEIYKKPEKHIGKDMSSTDGAEQTVWLHVEESKSSMPQPLQKTLLKMNQNLHIRPHTL